MKTKGKGICRNNKDQEKQLTIDKQYEFLEIGKLGDAVYIIADDGRGWWMNINRFEMIVDKQEG